MTSDARFVLDTGVLVSAVLLPRSVPRQAIDLAFTRGIVLASADTINELDGVLRRPTFNHYLREAERLLFRNRSPTRTDQLKSEGRGKRLKAASMSSERKWNEFFPRSWQVRVAVRILSVKRSPFSD